MHPQDRQGESRRCRERNPRRNRSSRDGIQSPTFVIRKTWDARRAGVVLEDDDRCLRDVVTVYRREMRAQKLFDLELKIDIERRFDRTAKSGTLRGYGIDKMGREPRRIEPMSNRRRFLQKQLV